MFLGTRRSFNPPAEIFLVKTQTISAQCAKVTQKTTFPQNLIKMILWRRKMQYWQPWRNIFDEGLQLFCSRSETKEKSFFPRKKLFSSRRSSGHVNYSFHNPVKKRRQKLKSFFPISVKIKYHNVFEKVFDAKCSLDT